MASKDAKKTREFVVGKSIDKVIAQEILSENSLGKKVTLKDKGKKVKSIEVEIESMDIEEVKDQIKPAGQQSILTKKGKIMKEILKKQETRLVNIAPDAGVELPTHSVTNSFTGEVNESYGEPLFVRVNGYTFPVPKGVPVEVPLSVYEVMGNQRNFLNEERRAMQARMKALQHNYSND
jgi:hypothetical protein